MRLSASVALLVVVVWVLSPVTATAEDSMLLDGVRVPAAQLSALYRAFQASRTSDKIVVRLLSKRANRMPQGDPHWHYAGFNSSHGRLNAIVWLNQEEIDRKAIPREAIASEVIAGMMLAVMDTEFAGAYWKRFYTAAAAKDRAAAASGGSAYSHRRSVAERLAHAYVDALAP